MIEVLGEAENVKLTEPELQQLVQVLHDEQTADEARKATRPANKT